MGLHSILDPQKKDWTRTKVVKTQIVGLDVVLNKNSFSQLLCAMRRTKGIRLEKKSKF